MRLWAVLARLPESECIFQSPAAGRCYQGIFCRPRSYSFANHKKGLRDHLGNPRKPSSLLLRLSGCKHNFHNLSALFSLWILCGAISGSGAGLCLIISQTIIKSIALPVCSSYAVREMNAVLGGISPAFAICGSSSGCGSWAALSRKPLQTSVSSFSVSSFSVRFLHTF